MKYLIATAVILFSVTIYAQSKIYPEKEAINKARAQIPVAGAPTDTLSPTGASDTSTQLAKNAVYMFTCGEDTHVRWCNSSTCTAVATDFRINSGVIIYFATGPTTEARYIAGIKNVTNGTCYINEMR